MKIFALIFLCALTYNVRCDEITKKHAIEAATECLQETGATEADIDAMLKHEPAGSPEAKCLRACTLKKIGILSGDGKMVKEAALKLIKAMAKGDAEKEAAGAEIIAICEGIDVSEDHCEAAAQYVACGKKEAEARGLTGF